MTDPTTASQERLKPGQAIGNYTLIEPIALTRLTSAFKARDQLLGRVVCFHQLHPVGSSEDAAVHAAVARYHAAYKPVAAQSPRLADAIDTVLDDGAKGSEGSGGPGISGGGSGGVGVYVVSELVQGLSLGQLIDQSEQEANTATPEQQLKRTLGVIGTAAVALGELHARGLAHGCLTPERVVLVGSNQLKITEPGFRLLLDPQYPLSLEAVPYTAPERIAGEAPGPRSDFYALGMMAYRALAGPAAYAEAFKTVLRDERNQALRWMKWQSNPKLSAPPLSTINPDIPEPVSQLIARLTDKTPTARLADAATLLQALQTHITTPGSPAPAPGSSGVQAATTPDVSASATGLSSVTGAPETSALPKQRRFPVVLGASILLWVVLIAVVSGFWLDKIKQERAAFIAPINNQIQITANDIQDGAATKAVVEAKAAVTLAGDDPTMGPIARAWEQLALGNAADNQGQFAQARDYYRQALAAQGFRNPKTTQQVQTRLVRAIDNAAFADGVDRVQEAIETMAFRQAQEQIDAWRPLVLTDAEAAALGQLETQLAEAMGTDSVQGILARVDAWLAGNRQEEALRLLQQQLDRGNTDPKLLDRYRQLSRQSGVARYVQTAEEAAANHDHAAATGAYDQALALAPADPQLRAARNRAFALDRVAQARTALTENRPEAAADLLTQALATDPQNAEAQSLQNTLNADARRAELIARGDLAGQQRQWDDAIAAYTQALGMTPELTASQAIRDKLTDAQVDQALDSAGTALEQNNLQEAQTHYAAASAVDPAHPRVTTFAGTLEQHRTYHRYLKDGQTAMQEGKFGPATTAFLRARKALRTVQIDALIEEARFENLLAQTRVYIAQGNARDAAAMLATLKTQNPDAEDIPALQSQIDNIR